MTIKRIVFANKDYVQDRAANVAEFINKKQIFPIKFLEKKINKSFVKENALNIISKVFGYRHYSEFCLVTKKNANANANAPFVLSDIDRNEFRNLQLKKLRQEFQVKDDIFYVSLLNIINPYEWYLS